MSLPRILIPHPIHQDGIDRLAGHFTVDAPAKFDDARKRESFAAADAVIVRNLGVDAALVDASPRLRVIAKHGAGVDNIDIRAATERGIVVASVPGGNADAVAEAAVTMMLAAIRQVPKVHNLVASGNYAARWNLQYEQLLGRTLGLLGIGSIGARVARICAAGFRMKVLAYDPALTAEQVRERGGEKVDGLPDLLRQADVVSLHLPLIPATRHVIGAPELAAMKPTAVLVNAARGPLVDETALVEALNSGRIAGAALDVFETEPPPADAPILTAKNIVLSPHTAGNTVDAARILATSSADIALAVFAGAKPAGFLNPEVWDKRRT
ncbi:MAG: hydroxyacid dehydrogenase [Rhizobiales bacterium]|nr:hydroxyacid dehydrogenase [Hyphomicrobiales bacterium]MBN9009645.1 hydroxyacid dehydrogenase [Hyphomicrobiales bacterium]